MNRLHSLLFIHWYKILWWNLKAEGELINVTINIIVI